MRPGEDLQSRGMRIQGHVLLQKSKGNALCSPAVGNYITLVKRMHWRWPRQFVLHAAFPLRFVFKLNYLDRRED